MDMHTTALNNKLTLVTGASSGLGEHFAQVLADAGARVVVVAARRIEKLDQLVTRIKNSGGSAMAVQVDVTDQGSVEQAIAYIKEEYGQLSILVNNAGVADSRTFLKIDEANWHQTLDVNLNGAWRVAHAVTTSMVAAQTPGCIVNIASILGLRVGFGNSAYAVSKAGVVQMTKAMALELGPKGIRVNAICPGYIETQINADYFSTEKGQAYIKTTPAGRTGRLDELNGPLLLLCSDAGSFINGVALPVDGGHLISSL
jgi:NAD(P)-dependent dehydrogenase (short-subunit alcohol dehydrogenase family)